MQKIFPEALTNSLNQTLSPFYLLTGTDLLLLEESKDQILQAARLKEFDEKTEITITNETNWDTLFEAAQSMGLFFSKQMMLLNLPESLNANQVKQLATLCRLSHSDLLLVFCLPKFTKAVEKQEWFTQIETQLIQVNCQTPDVAKLPNWLAHRAKLMGLQIEPEAAQLLCYSYEGNLLALKQALQFLQLRFIDGKITLKRAKEIVEQSAQFTPFQWVDALLEGKIGRAERILNYLKNEDVQPVVLLRIIQKELFILLEISRLPTPLYHYDQPLLTNQIRAEFDRLKIWQNKRPFYVQACQRLTYRKLFILIQQLAVLEKQLKQEFSEQIWLELGRYSTLFK